MLERVFHIKSIKGKLTAVMMTVTGIVLLLVTLAFVVNETLTFRKAIHQELKTLAGIIGLNTTAAVTFGDRKSAESTLAALSARPNLRTAYLLMPDGEVFASYVSQDASGEYLPFFEGNGQQQLRDNLASLAKTERDSNQVWEWDLDLEVVERVLLDNQEVGVVVIQSDLKELIDRLKWFFVLVLIVTAIALGVALFLSEKMHRPISDPILDLAETMKKVSEGREYGIRVTKKTSDEIGQLIDGFNDMLAQIQKRDEELERAASEMKEGNEELKAFIYSAAHDLRQPLVNIKGFTIELRQSLQEISAVTAKHPERFTPEERNKLDDIYQNDVQAAIGFIGSSVERMDDLINALLKLSQVGHRVMRLERIDMNALVRTVRESMTHQIREKNTTLTIGDLPDVVADRLAMEQIMANLLDNAVKYLSRDCQGVVELSGEKAGPETIYHVRDNGRGISVDDMPKLFKIFRRLGVQDVPGQGVGLAYVRSLVRRQGGRIWCESKLGEGSVFSFTVLQRREEDR